jgi:LmbE family N-acetylglucosaminyl deacetylase
MRILAIGAHYDDIEIGCGGTLLKHIANGDELLLGVTSSDEHRTGDVKVRYAEQLASAEQLMLDEWDIHRFSYHDEVHDIVGILDKISPDILFVHHEFDTHQDHRRASFIGQAVGRKRNTTTLFYDSGSSYDFYPTVFSMIDYKKKDKLMRNFITQITMGAVNLDIIKKKSEYLATLLTNEPAQYAEGFVVRKMIYEV